MKSITNSIKLFGIYSLVMGVALLVIPHLILPLFNLSIEGEQWIRMLGFVLICSSYYYIRSANKKNIDFAVYTIHARIAAPFVVLILFLVGVVEPSLLLFGLVDGLGGLWTLISYQRQKRTMKYASDKIISTSITHTGLSKSL